MPHTQIMQINSNTHMVWGASIVKKKKSLQHCICFNGQNVEDMAMLLFFFLQTFYRCINVIDRS